MKFLGTDNRRRESRRMIEGAVHHKLLFWIIAGLAITFLAPTIGNWIADENYFNMLLLGGTVGLVLFSQFLGGYWLILAFLVVTVSFTIMPTGFKIGPGEMVYSILGLYFVSNIWKKDFFHKASPLRQWGAFSALSLLFLLYLIVHSVLSITSPNQGIDVAWTNISKTVIAFTCGFSLLWFVINTTQFTKLPKNPYAILGLILLLALLFNIGVRAYVAVTTGLSFQDEEVVSASDGPSSGLFIPIINLTENVYQLRDLAPLSFLFGLMIRSSKSVLVKRQGVQLLGGLLMLLALIGGVFSGGRSTLFVAIGLGCVYLFYKNRPGPIILLFFIGLLGVFSVKIMYDSNPASVPIPVQRAVAILPFMGMTEAKARIDSSSDWRYELFQRALEDWKQSERTFFFGRSVYAYTSVDEQLVLTGGQEGELEVNLRRGTTHNLITDLLVPFGVVGFILYFGCMASLLYGLLKARSAYRSVAEINDFSLISLVLLIATLLQALLGGSPLQSAHAVLAGVTLLLVNRYAIQKLKEPLLSAVVQ